MVILSSEEFRAQENNRIQMGLERLINKINLQSTRGFGHMGNPSPTVETSLNNNEYIGYLMITNLPVCTAPDALSLTEYRYNPVVKI